MIALVSINAFDRNIVRILLKVNVDAIVLTNIEHSSQSYHRELKFSYSTQTELQFEIFTYCTK